MAGKKKSLANKLSRMSDEERARYLQHRAEIEEEAKRRKEQLIATFMKKKIKKEDAFSRLNMSKINQNWHQILRKIKVKEMKDEVSHLKKYIERVVNYKNRRISKLMDELEEAEEQYLNNFNAHSKHLDQMIDRQNEDINKLQSQYQEELDELLNQNQKEHDSIVDCANSETAYLKTVIYAQETKAAKELRDSWDYYSIQLYEIEHMNRIKLQHLRTTRGETESALWRQMLQVVRLYVQRTDVRRSHLQELRRMDAESADDIRKNEERISREEELIKILNVNNDNLLQSRSEKIKYLEAKETTLKVKFIKVRKVLKTDLALDEKQLRFSTAVSNETLNDLSVLLKKGNHLVLLSNTCQKFVTEREKILNWLPIMHIEEVSECDELVKEEDIPEKGLKKGSGLTDDEKLFEKALKKGFSLPTLSDDMLKEASRQKEKPRPKSSIPPRFIKSATTHMATDNVGHAFSPETLKIAPIEEVKIKVKKCNEITEIYSPSLSLSNQQSFNGGRNFLKRCCESLEKLENFWVTYNKVNIDVLDLKKEKNVLKNENKQLRGIIRAVLEAAALTKNIPDSRVCTRVPSHRRSGTYSAPLRRIVFN